MHINIERITRLHYLISHASTGTPEQLALKLSVSEATLYRDLQMMRNAGAPIIYNSIRQSYVYERSVDLKLLSFESHEPYEGFKPS